MSVSLLDTVAKLFPLHRIQTDALLLWALATLVFVAYYVKRWREVGPLSVDTYFVIRFLYVPMVFMFPFAFSPLNTTVLPPEFYQRSVPFLEPFFRIAVVGLLAFAVGGWAALYLRVPLIGLRTMEESFRSFWVTKRGVITGIVLSLLFICIMLSLGFEFGKARQISLLSGQLRPLFNFWHALHPFVILITLVYAFMRKAWWAYALGIGLAAVGAFGETRYASVEPIALFLIMLCFFYGKRIKLRWVVPVLVVLMFGAMYVAGIRTGSYGLEGMARYPTRILYGNHLCDLRDTALVMSGWDKKLLMGKTHAAAALIFIPSHYWKFRDENKIGRFTLRMAGMTNLKTTHPGLRPVIFGEFYFNYGLIGVVLSAFLSGLLIFRLAHVVQEHVTGSSSREKMTLCLAAMTYTSLIYLVLHTSSFYVFYITIFLILVGWVVGRKWPAAG